MLKNSEIKIYLFALVLLSLIGTILCLHSNIWAGIIMLVISLLMITISLFFVKWRYKEIAHLTLYFNKIAQGEYDLDIRDNEEGELSILKNELYKIAVTLREQAEILKKDKNYLADALSDVSHQLKTPITSMFVMVDLLNDEKLPLNKRIEFTKNIESQLRRLQWLVESLLKLSKIDAGAISFKREKVIVKELIAKATEHLLIPMELKEQSLKINGNDSIYFLGDFNWSAEALANIIKNCIEHTPEKGTITIEFKETPIYTMINIKDTGAGIAKTDLPYIFKRFYKGQNAHNDSIGIGLAMAESIIQKQGGLIDVKSEKGLGTQFSLKIYNI